jgi:hypothetical protein
MRMGNPSQKYPSHAYGFATVSRDEIDIKVTSPGFANSVDVGAFLALE